MGKDFIFNILKTREQNSSKPSLSSLFLPSVDVGSNRTPEQSELATLRVSEGEVVGGIQWSEIC